MGRMTGEGCHGGHVGRSQRHRTSTDDMVLELVTDEDRPIVWLATASPFLGSLDALDLDSDPIDLSMP